ncbi:class I SAM-dependent methyltransferase [Campylobacter lari]|nr:class I SAM-dependent methyltransferase [Campylobacter lari]
MITDKKYWTNFYQLNQEPFAASLFAEFCCKHYIKKHDLLLELGCGNGRDAIFFQRNLIKVDAIDLCENEIHYLNQKYKSDDLKFICMDFSQIDFVDKYDIIYSRFTLHSINEEQENRLFQAVYRALKNYKDYNILTEKKKKREKKEGGYFCIEARGMKNSLYGLGKQVNKDCFIYNDHFRRFIDIDITCEKLQNIGFNIILAEENINFAPFNKENDYFIRIVVKK